MFHMKTRRLISPSATYLSLTLNNQTYSPELSIHLHCITLHASGTSCLCHLKPRDERMEPETLLFVPMSSRCAFQLSPGSSAPPSTDRSRCYWVHICKYLPRRGTRRNAEGGARVDDRAPDHWPPKSRWKGAAAIRHIPITQRGLGWSLYSGKYRRRPLGLAVELVVICSELKAPQPEGAGVEQ